MSLFGAGHGYFGLPKSLNLWIRLAIIWCTFGTLSYYFATHDNSLLAVVCLGLGLLFTAIDLSR